MVHIASFPDEKTYKTEWAITRFRNGTLGCGKQEIVGWTADLMLAISCPWQLDLMTVELSEDMKIDRLLKCVCLKYNKQLEPVNHFEEYHTECYKVCDECSSEIKDSVEKNYNEKNEVFYQFGRTNNTLWDIIIEDK